MADRGWVEVIFSAPSPRYGAESEDRMQVPLEDVAQLVADGVAKPATKSSAKEAGVDPAKAATAK
jgi:hypothetical protein